MKALNIRKIECVFIYLKRKEKNKGGKKQVFFLLCIKYINKYFEVNKVL